MYKKGLVLALAFALIANSAFARTSSPSPDWYRFNAHGPYVGFDLQERRMAFKTGFGENLLHRTAPQGNIYAGFLINEYMGLEAGYEATRTRSRTATLQGGEVAGGFTIPDDPDCAPITFRSNIKIQGPHLGVVAYLPICDICCPFEWYGYLGVARFRATAERATLAMGTDGTAGSSRKLSAHKTVFRGSVGIQYKWTEHLSLRGTVTWVDTRRIVIFSNDGISNPPAFKPKGSVAYGLGAVWNF